MADNTAEIARLEGLLKSGAKFVMVDGIQVQIDPSVVQDQLRRLKAEDDTYKGRRPVTANINLSGF